MQHSTVKIMNIPLHFLAAAAAPASHSVKSQFQTLHIPSLPQIEGDITVERLTL